MYTVKGDASTTDGKMTLANAGETGVKKNDACPNEEKGSEYAFKKPERSK